MFEDSSRLGPNLSDGDPSVNSEDDWEPPPPAQPKARRSKLTPEVQERIYDQIGRLGVTYDVACRAAGIGYRTFFHWRERGRLAKSGMYFDFVQGLDEAEARFEAHHLHNIEQAATEGEMTKRTIVRQHPNGEMTREIIEERKQTWQASKFMLERRIPQRYSERLVMEQQVHLTDTTARKVIFEFHDVSDHDEDYSDAPGNTGATSPESGSSATPVVE